MRRIFLGFLILIVPVIGLAALTPTNQQNSGPTPVGVTPLFFVTNTPQSIPLSTYLPSIPTQTVTPSPTITLSPTPSPTVTPSPTLTPSPSPTVPLLTLTPPNRLNLASYVNPTAEITTPEGWSCGDFPCEDDIDGFKQRIRVPTGYDLTHVGRFPGQPMQITYGPDGRLYATIITDPAARTGSVYTLDAEGNVRQYGPRFIAPLGLAFQPGTDVLYVSARVTLMEGGGLWRILPDGNSEAITTDLPCCFQVIDNQPAGMVFGPDGYLYLGVGALTDRAEPPNPRVAQFAELQPYEASILRIQPHTGQIEVFAQGIRYPFDLTFDSTGQFYATDTGLLAGNFDRLLQVSAGGHYGWPYWRGRGCEGCPLPSRDVNLQPDFLNFPPYTLPRGVVAYTGAQFPANVFDSLFVALWHNTENAQRIIRLEPDRVGEENYIPERFVTGLIRPIDVTLDPEGALVIADFIYGHIWRVSFVAEGVEMQTAMPTNTGPIFVTSTPRP